MTPTRRLAPLFALLVAALLAAGCSSDGSDGGGGGRAGGGDGITAERVTVPVPATEDQAALYFRLRNDGDTDDELVGATAEGAGSVSIHRSEVTEDGLARMVEQDSVAVPAGGTVDFETGGLHLMILDPPPLAAGDTVTVTLRFRHAPDLRVDAAVVEPGADDEEHQHG